MIYCGYGIIMDFSALSVAMWWWSLSKITWFYIGYAILCVLTLVMGVFYMFYNRRLFVKID